MSERECLLDSRWKSCCCDCQWLVRDMSHWDTDGLECTHQRGWICIGFTQMEGCDNAHSGWRQHGMCELHWPRGKLGPREKQHAALMVERDALRAKLDILEAWSLLVSGVGYEYRAWLGKEFMVLTGHVNAVEEEEGDTTAYQHERIAIARAHKKFLELWERTKKESGESGE